MKVSLFARQKQSGGEHLDILLKAVVSVYFYMAKIGRMSGAEVNFIDRLLRTMFGNEIPLYQIEQARRQIMPLREAANFLNSHFHEADKLLLILNLVTLAYHDREKVQVLGNVEIVELVDLLQLDVNILDSIYDLFESDIQTVKLPWQAFLNRQNRHLKNSLLWGCQDADFIFHGNCDNPVIFILIEELTLVCVTCSDLDTALEDSYFLEPGSSTKTWLIPNQFYYFRPHATLHLGLSRLDEAPGDRTLKLDLEAVWTIHSLRISPDRVPLPAGKERWLYLQYDRGRLLLLPSRSSKLNKGREVALDDIVPELDQELPLAALLTKTESAADSDHLVREHYLEYRDNRFHLISYPVGNALLRFQLVDQQWQVQPLGEPELYINRIALKETAPFSFNHDVLSLGTENYIINRNWELIEIPIDIQQLNVVDIQHSFVREARTALDGISFSLRQGSMLAIMGPSGCGKTTLLRVLLGEIVPGRAQIEIDGMDYLANYPLFQKHVGYVPQDDLLFAHLTVYENVYFNLMLRLPKLKDKEEIRSRIVNLLNTVGLYEQRDMIVGDVLHKTLSGGQRRRLNIALELISNPMIIILDEPTSGLSTKDSENITQFLHEMKQQGKIIICTIHQPNATIFRSFDHVLLLDNGGVQVYFGGTDAVFDYFDAELDQSGSEREQLHTKKSLSMPEYFHDLIELPDNLNQRRFKPDYWKQKYRDHRFRQTLDAEPESGQTDHRASLPTAREKPCLWRNLKLMIRRSFINKLRSRINLSMTLGVAPLLALLTSLILRNQATPGNYSFYNNNNFPLFCFISVIIFIFIGLANSIDDILGEKRIILREKKMNLGMMTCLNSKYFVLLAMTLVQSLLYHIISSAILGMKGAELPLILSYTLSGIIGYHIGLLCSALITDRSAIINVLPLILIPQIMFGGAVILFSDMNSALKLNRRVEIPEFCQLIPSRWLYEHSVLAQHHLNRRSRLDARFQRKLEDKSDPRYMELVDEYNQGLERLAQDDYINHLALSYIRHSHGRYVSQKRNIFLSYKSRLLGLELKTIHLNWAVIALFIAAMNILTWIKLRYFYH